MLSRGKAAPEAIEGGWRVQVDEPDQTARYVFPNAGEPVQNLMQSVAPTLTPIKVCATLDEVAPLLTPPWVVDRTSPMMAKAILAAANATVAEGYATLVTGAGDLLIAMAVTRTQDIVAGGRVALIEDTAIFDQIWTHEAHRRRRLGSSIMRTLENVAVERGAVRGMLVATEAGCALYSTLGWRAYAPYTTAIVPNA